MQDEQRYLPNANRLSVLTAAVLLAYGLAHLVGAPGFTLTVQLPGFYFALPLNLGTAMILMAAGLAATGMDWLLHGHPTMQGQATIEHWLLPTLTAFVIGILLSILPSGPVWWIGFAFSAGILIAIFLAEYISVDAGAPNYALASAGLTALSYAMFLILVIAIRSAGARLVLVVPAVFLAAGLLSLRTSHLHFSGRWEIPWSLGIGLICAQLAGGLHYWPLSPLQFGLFLLGPLYALTTLANNLGEDTPLRRAATEPGIILGITWVAAALFR